MIITSAVVSGAIAGVAMDGIDATAVVLIHQKLKARKERIMNQQSTNNETNSATKHFWQGTKITGVKSGRVLRAVGKGIFTTDLADIGSVAKGAVVTTAHGVGELKHGMTDGRAERKARKQQRRLDEAKALLVANGIADAGLLGLRVVADQPVEEPQEEVVEVKATPKRTNSKAQAVTSS